MKRWLVTSNPKYKNYSKKAQKTLSKLWQDVKDCGENNPELKKKILEQIESAEWFADLSMGGDYTIPADTYSVKLEPLKVYIGDRVLSLDESYEWFQEAIEEKAAREKLDENGLVRCGCGNTLILRQDAGKCFPPYDDPSDIETWTRTPSWWVECSKCLLEIGKRYDSDWYDKAGNCEERGCFHSAEEAIKAANRAMGVKGADE